MKKSYVPSNIRKSVMNIAQDRGYTAMRKSQVNPKSSQIDMTKSQMTRNIIQYSLKHDFTFNYKEFDFGNTF